MAQRHGEWCQRGSHEEGRQRDFERSAAARSIRSTRASAVSIACRRAPTCAPLPESRMGPRSRARRRCAGSPRSTFPDIEQDYEFVSLRHPDEYPLNEGRIVSNQGLDIAVREYDEHFVEEQVRHSTALHARSRRAAPISPAAGALQPEFRSPPAACQKAATEAGLRPGLPQSVQEHRRARPSKCCSRSTKRCVSSPPTRSPGRRSCTGGPRRLRARPPPRRRAACCISATARTRTALIADANIVPPTSQNQSSIEHDLRHRRAASSSRTTRCVAVRQAVRNYDPCISCATHFLRLQLNRES